MIAALLLPLTLQAAEPPVAGWNCDNPMQQQEMNWCAAREFEAQDALLNDQWKITAAIMKERDRQFHAQREAEYDTREGYFETLLESQRAWLRYRDAQCRAEGYLARGGSMEPLLVATCKTRLTQSRTNELKSLVSLTA